MKKYAFAIQLKAFLILAILGNFASAEQKPSLCDNAYQPSLAITPASCGADSKVIIFGEKHFATISSRLRELAENEAPKTYSFFEGRVFDSAGHYVNGLEDDLVYQATAMAATQYVFDSVLKNPSEKTTINGIDFLQSYKSNFFTTILLRNDIWSEIKKAGGLSDKTVESYLDNEIRKIQDMPLEKQYFGVLADRDRVGATVSIEAAFELSKLWLDRAQKQIFENPRYKFLADGPKENLMGDGRNILFSKAVADTYCQAAREKKMIWIQVGAAHVDGVKCLLTHFLPPGTAIESRTAENYSELEQLDYNKTAKNRIFNEIQKRFLENKIVEPIDLETWSDGLKITISLQENSAAAKTIYRQVLKDLKFTSKDFLPGRESILPSLD